MQGYAHLVDVHGAFLLGGFEHDLITNKKRKIYMKIPPAFYEFLPKWCRPFCEWLMELLKTLYGTKQAAKRFWLLLLSIMKSMGFKYNRVDPCLYYKWTDEGLKIWASWVDDCLHIGASKESVLKSKDVLTNKLECDDNGEMKEYVGVKMDYNKEKGMLKMTQPVLLQSFKDEFELPTENFNTPASPGSTLQLVEDGETIGKEEQSKYRSGVGKLLHMMRWSRPDILNAVRETSSFMGEANPAHEKAMQRILKYCTDTPNRGIVLKPKGLWDGKDKNFLFCIRGKGDSEHAKDQATRKSVGGHVVYLNEAPVVMTSKMQRFVGLSSTETELIEQCELGQNMLFVWRLLKEM
jgi:hypothetical protein